MPDRPENRRRGASPFAVLIRRNPVCEKYYCTTCGGIWVFLSKVEEFVGDGQSAHLLIAGFGTNDARLLLDASALPVLLGHLPQASVDEIVRAWMPTAMSDSRFAAMAVVALERIPSVAPEDLVRLLHAATPYLLEDEKTRGRVARAPSLDLRHVPALHQAVEADHERERRASEAAAAALEERRRAERAAECARAAAWRAAEVAKQESIDSRNAARLSAMEGYRTRLAGLSVAEQLAFLLNDSSIPIEHYPLELAPQVTADVLFQLEPSARRALTMEVARTPLRRWRRLSSLLARGGQ